MPAEGSDEHARSSSSQEQHRSTRAPSPRCPTDAVLVAADGGLDHARAAGLEPSVLVGDLDSVSAIGLAWASEHTTVVRHPVDKAATDTELAIAYAATLAPERILLRRRCQGDRLDHAVAALGALGAAAARRRRPARGVVGRRPARRRPRSRVRHDLDLPAGTTFSVLAMHGVAEGVDVARRPLAAARTTASSRSSASASATRSSEPPVTVSVESGVVTIVVPGEVS